MIDELPTRAALTVAAFAILAVGLALVAVPGRDEARDAAQSLADHLARELDAVSSIDGEVRLRGDDFRLPDRLAGAPYALEVHASFLRVRVQGHDASAPLKMRVHPFEPSSAAFTPEDLAKLDAFVVAFRPSDPFVVERTWRWVSAEPTYLTFVYLPR